MIFKTKQDLGWTRYTPRLSYLLLLWFMLEQLNIVANSVMMLLNDLFVSSRCFRHRLGCDKRIGKVAYRLELPEELSNVHPTFHVSNLRKCLADHDLIVPLDDLQVNESLHFVEKPVGIMDRQTKQLRRSRIPIVKVRWEGKRGAEFTWELKSDMKSKYPQLFR
ncbi:putative chromatin remodeling & transcriptional activation CHROMO-DOMAIN family [Helianthus anomalus]